MKERASIARIDVGRMGAAPVRGTGTLVSTDLVLTALHVVADRRQDPPVFFAGPIWLTFPGDTVDAVPVAGMWNGREDWVLLRCTRSPAVPHLPLGELGAYEQTLEWHTYGFADAYPTGGMVFEGRVLNPEGTYEDVPAIQLYSDQAAAGDGSPVAGLSGAPCLVDGAVVGVIRSSLLKHGLNVAGTLYACPTRFALDRAEALLALPDPCRGLPGLPRRELPTNPYRSLKWYTEADAEIFFGRSADIRKLYLHLVDPEGARITLFFGQSGVGKSSLLDAGLIPRLRPSYDIRYVRRDAARGLRACLDEATSGDWHALEASGERPLLVILDQVEEAFTRPLGDPTKELAVLLDALVALFGPQARRPRGRLVLAFRKEWLAEIRERLAERRLRCFEYFLERLGREEVIEVVHGLRRTERLRRHYRATIDADLGVQIVGDLVEDYGSSVAPTLQLLMTRLWTEAQRDSAGAPALTKVRYLALKQQGIHLADFLRQAISRLPPEVQPRVDSGLVDDVLEAHTTVLGTAETRTRTALGKRYAALEPKALDGVLRALENEYLLTNPGRDLVERDKERTRLAHDTLAPLVRERFRTSALPGQRARRVMEARAPEWEGEQRGRVLDASDLKRAEQGLLGMRSLTEPENRLLRASQQARYLGKVWLALGMVSVLAVAGVLVWLYTERDEERAQGVVLQQRARVEEARRYFDLANSIQDPAEALLYLSRAVEVAPQDDPRLGLYVTRAQHQFTRLPPVRASLSGVPLESAELSSDGRRALILDFKKNIKVIDFDARDAVSGVQWKGKTTLLLEAESLLDAPRLSPDGRWALTVANDRPLEPDDYGQARFQLWDVGSAKPTIQDVLRIPRVAFSGDSRAVLSGFTPDLHGFLLHTIVVARLETSAWKLSDPRWLGHARFNEPLEGAPQSHFLELTNIGTKSQARVINVASGLPAFRDAPALPLGGDSDTFLPLWVRLSPQGSALAVILRDKRAKWIETWDARKGIRLARMRIPMTEFEHPAIVGVSDDGQWVALANDERDSEKRSLADVTVIEQMSQAERMTKTGLTCVLNSPLSRSLGVSVLSTEAGRFQDGFALACQGASHLQLWMKSRPKPALRSIDVQDAVAGQLTLDSGRALTISRAGWLGLHSLFETAPEKVLELIPFEGGVSPEAKLTAARFSEDGSRLVILETTSSKEGPRSRISVREAPDWRSSWKTELPGNLNGFVMTQAAERIATFNSHKRMLTSLTLWDTQTQQPPRNIPEPTESHKYIFGVSFDADRKLVVGQDRRALGGNGLVSIGPITVERFDFDDMETLGMWMPMRQFGRLDKGPLGLGVAGRYIIYQPSLEEQVVGSELPFLLQDVRTGKPLPSLRFERGIGPRLMQTLLDRSERLMLLTVGPDWGHFTFEGGAGELATRVMSINGQAVMRALGGEAFILADRPVDGPAAYCAAGPWFAYVRTPPASSGSIMTDAQSTLHIESLASGTELAAFGHPPALDVRFSPDCEKLLTVSTDGVVREWFVSHKYAEKPAWVAQLGALATGSRILGSGSPEAAGSGFANDPARAAFMGALATGARKTEGGNREAVPGLLSGPERIAFIRELKTRALQGDRGAKYVLDHLNSVNVPH